MKVTFPHMGNAWIVVQALFETLGIDFIVPPANNKQTLNLGTALAPESACLPFKLNLGNYIAAAAEGADTIAITGGVGPCRFGYYGELERQILSDAGYNYEVIILEPPDGSVMGLLQRIRYLAGAKNSWLKIVKAAQFAYRKSAALDRMDDLMHYFRPNALNPQSADKLHNEALGRLIEASSDQKIAEAVDWLRQKTQEITAREPRRDADRLKIAVIGEIYTLLEPFTSQEVEKELGNLGAQVDRSLYLSGWVGQHVFQGLAQGFKPIKPFYRLAQPYLNHFVGGHGQETVGSAVHFAQQGFDGIIQMLPLGCMPEIVASSILPRIQKDYGIPIMTLTVDEHTGRAGIQTRLEAFVDLLERSPKRNPGWREGELRFARN